MNSENELSPLDRIRQAEAEVARQIAASRERGEQRAARAREQADVLLQEAREVGRREGQAQYRRLILQAQDEVRALCLESEERLEALRRARVERMDAAVARVVAIVAAAGERER